MAKSVLQDPRKKYFKPTFRRQPQKAPGLANAMTPKPDHGEKSYKGSGRLKGRRAVVTGGDSGIGRAAAIAFAREGADVLIAYLPQEQPDADEVVELLSKEPVKVATFAGDISQESVCQKLIATALQKLGGIDILANVAGKQVALDTIAELTTEQFDQTFKVNVYAMFWLSKYALAHMEAGSAIINTTSIQAVEPSPALLDYAATKGAIMTFTAGLAKQVAPRGIRVNAVAPGPIWTPLQPSGGQPPAKVEEFGAQSPLGRPGQPAEVAPVYVLLASDEASFITGETYGVTGGNPLR